MVSMRRMFGVIGLVIVLAAEEPYTPPRYQRGALPLVPIQAVGGGEVFLELAVTSGGPVSDVKILRATPPFTQALGDAVRGWQFRPAEEAEKPAPGESANRNRRKRVASKALVAGMFRPPTFNAPTLGSQPQDLASASDEIPFPTAVVVPLYPPLARDNGIVLVEVRVGGDGQVVDAVVIRSAQPFDPPALDAARQWTFRPARRNGITIETFAYIVFAFRQPITRPPN